MPFARRETMSRLILRDEAGLPSAAAAMEISDWRASSPQRKAPMIFPSRFMAKKSLDKRGESDKDRRSHASMTRKSRRP